MRHKLSSLLDLFDQAHVNITPGCGYEEQRVWNNLWRTYRITDYSWVWNMSQNEVNSSLTGNRTCPPPRCTWSQSAYFVLTVPFSLLRWMTSTYYTTDASWIWGVVSETSVMVDQHRSDIWGCRRMETHSGQPVLKCHCLGIHLKRSFGFVEQGEERTVLFCIA